MAVVGDVLLTPEANWKRDDDNNSALTYTGVWTTTSDSNWYNSTKHVSNDASAIVRFKFKGTDLRIIGTHSSTYSDSISITIDGIQETYSQYKSTTSFKVISYEKLGLTDTMHTIEIKLINAGYFSIDAIDTNSSGRLLHVDEVTAITDLAVGKRIRANYRAFSNKTGTISGLGEETSSFMTTVATQPNGDFYFIMADTVNGKRKLVADRNIQNAISWDALNNIGVASGVGANLPTILGKRITTSEIKNLTYSYGYSTSTPDKLFDNNGTTGWNSYQNDVDGRTYFTVELFEPQSLIGFNIRNITAISSGQNGLRDYKILGSNDNVNFTELYTGSHANNTIDEEVILNSKEKYLFYTFESLSSWFSGKRVTFCEFEWIIEGPSIPSEGVELSLRLLSGGTTNTDTDNEWDNIIVNSNLNGTITPGDDSIWDWSGQYSWTSTVYSSGGSRIVRGNTTSSTWNYAGSNAVISTTTGYRPVLEILDIFIERNKYLIQDGTDIYSVQDGALVLVGQAPVTEEMFTTQGLNALSGFTSDIFTILANPTVLYYRNQVDIGTRALNIGFVPQSRTVLSTGDLDISKASNIDSFTVLATESGAGKVRMAASFDSGLTWKSYDSVNSVPVTIDINNIGTEGLDIATFNSLGIIWNQMRAGANTVRFAYYLEHNQAGDIASVDSLDMQADFTGMWRKAIHGTDYDYVYTNNKTLQVEFLRDGTYKVNYVG